MECLLQKDHDEDERRQQIFGTRELELTLILDSDVEEEGIGTAAKSLWLNGLEPQQQDNDKKQQKQT